ncbi:hypothetical protein [Peribacillus sp. SCS-155]|uniref:hypothetical protein n=1 Tax=Peribacillus sedimenti TaxID=3115297 RepID=UPI0039057AB1
MGSRNAILGTFLVAIAAYLFRNKESRNKAKNMLISLVDSETTQTLENETQRTSTSQQDGGAKTQDDDLSSVTTYQEQSLLGTDFAHKREDDAHSLAEAPKYL